MNEEQKEKRAAYMRRYRRKLKVCREQEKEEAWNEGVNAAVETVNSMLRNGNSCYLADGRIHLCLMGTTFQKRVLR